ncbi:MAG TPA: ATP-dependent DNA helicase PcrA [Firmicutes bacterium]|nr:ATP-dependent DNA helicase PcrA [Bacillota bacterium]
MEYLETLNEMQKKATRHIDGPCLVMAGAGSGKTKVLTSRIAHLIDNGIPDYNILAITFTNKAAAEMKERVNKIVPASRAFIGTFHSFGLKIIRENAEEVGLTRHFTIVDSDDQVSIIKRILKEKNLDSKKFSPNYIRSRISFLKNEMLSMEEINRTMNTPIDKIVVEVYQMYENTLSKSNAVDFDDLLLKPVRLFLENRQILDRYQDHYPYILVDEYQDTNPVQYKLTRILADKYKNIFVVGDMNQSIYSFRQADYRNILNFERDFKDALVIKLEQNYRSTQVILDAANSVIKNNKEKKDLKLWSERKDGALVNYMRAYDEAHEVKLVIDEIGKLLGTYKSYNSFAILYRTNAQSRAIEENLLAFGVPYRIFGGFSYINRKEIKDLIAYLKLINNKADEVSLRRIVNVPKRGIGEATLREIEKESLIEDKTMFDCMNEKKSLGFRNAILDMEEFMEEHTLTELVDYVIDRSGIRAMYEAEGTLEADIRLDNLMEFKSLTTQYENRTGNVDLDEFLNEISLMSDVSKDEEVADAVTLMTLHSAKGLEFDVVFLVGMEEGLFPHTNSLMEEGGLDEERRLCYVGITRARDILYLTNAKRRMLYGKDSMNIPSRFIGEIDEALIKKNTLGEREIQGTSSKEYYTEENDDLKLGDLINHETFGHGVIVKMEGDLIDVAFKIGLKKVKKNHKSITKL